MTHHPGNPRVAVVVGSGGLKCAASIGLWKVLVREHIEVGMTVGCSGGSIYASALALGKDLAEIEQATLGFWTNDIMAGYAHNMKAAMSGELKFDETSGLVDDALLMERITGYFGDATFADTRFPLYLVATDFRTGEKVILESGRIVDAIRASLAIPVIFRPWPVGDLLLTDGAASDPLPVDVAIKEGGQVIIAMGFELPYRARLRSMNAVTSHLNAIYMNNILRATYAFYNLVHHTEIITIMPEFARSTSLLETEQLPYIIEQGVAAADEQIPYLRRLLDSVRQQNDSHA